MNKVLRSLSLLGIAAVTAYPHAVAAEGGYSNYIPGTYGDFGMALAPTQTWTLRNDTDFYAASTDRSVGALWKSRGRCGPRFFDELHHGTLQA